MASGTKITLPNARPYAFSFPLSTTAFVVIDMQRDFLDPNGFGSTVCGNPAIISSVRKIVPNVREALDAARRLGLHTIYTREGHLSDLSDLPAAKKLRQTTNGPNGGQSMGIGDEGPMGKLLVRGEKGHDIIDELKPSAGDSIIDKPGKGSFWGTGFHRLLLARGITHLILTGVTTECCVTSTLRECNDRGYECCVLSDCTDGFDKQMVTGSLEIACCQNGLFGYVGNGLELVAQAEQINRPQASLSYAETILEAATLPSITELGDLYRDGLLDPETVMRSVLDRIAKYEVVSPAVWIARENPEDVLAAARKLSTAYSGKSMPPLFGIPFAVKDNIDVKGVVTTAACDSFSYIATSTAPAIQYLLDAGAIYIGKLNLDQLATGLTGCRSPYGTPHSFYSKKHISGGSSSGSAVAVAAGLVSFAIGTDTAGSVRVPAAFNGVVGFKPTKGTISARGVVPACQSLDTIGILAPSLEDARQVWFVMDRCDALDPYAKSLESLPTWMVDYRGPKEGGFTFGTPPDFMIRLCSAKYQELFRLAVDTLQSCGGTLVDIDYAPFAEAGDLIYGASLVHERLASIGHDFISKNIDTFHPATKMIFQSLLSSNLSAWEVFRDQATQRKCIARARKTFNKLDGGIDVLVVPTVPFHPRIQEILDNPLAINSKLGVFTHSANVVDLCGVSVNAGWVEEAETRLPFGITLLGGSGYDGKLLDIATIFEKSPK
ncbi:amidase signature enzyme [Trichoderma citrinoviride]|uniref:Amidase signature enzyme n=1 Tax=Trichoderma citrinoviride TaxID=58853 RepID=A0A2T4B040_9HYPO|nr:amidase signature enzyme [Trichoderma citrinoviride]PTB62685.1 amidase signature enzyme [Trichoderma citrinoviride]